ncbi:MAG: FAD-dependent oxidoreductase [Firmicutes bacterium]|nr:FAD-dependent oxidoreductase [Bacillota bacterium]
MFDVAIYGGSLAGCAAAVNTARGLGRKRLVLINPEPTPGRLGGIATVGGQNFFDIRRWRGTPPQRGSFARWRSQVGDFYKTDYFSDILCGELDSLTNVSIRHQYDIEWVSLDCSGGSGSIRDLVIRGVRRDECGWVRWAHPHTRRVVSARVFIDASDHGRLALRSDPSNSVGRYDWPSEYLDPSERMCRDLGRQQVATLMFKVVGVARVDNPDMSFSTDARGSVGCWGGRRTCTTDPVVIGFNNRHGPRGFAIKPLNAAQDGPGSREWWVNTLLVFNVDGRAFERDRGTACYPAVMRPDYRNVDEAWVGARGFLRRNRREFLRALRRFPGFAGVDFVYGEDGYPRVGDVLYLRETIHTARCWEDIANGTEDTNYEVSTVESVQAGDSPDSGADAANYPSRVGLGYYWSDINAYQFRDLRGPDGRYDFSVAARLRPDLGIVPGSPDNPVYLPYECLISRYAENLLVPGYAVGCSAFAWSEMRVFPNLCVLGDAAGVAAAYAARKGLPPRRFSLRDIARVQEELVSGADARIDK